MDAVRSAYVAVRGALNGLASKSLFSSRI